MRKVMVIALLCLCSAMVNPLAFSEEFKSFEYGQNSALSGSGSWCGITMERRTKAAHDKIAASGTETGCELASIVTDRQFGRTTPARNPFINGASSAPTLPIIAMIKGNH